MIYSGHESGAVMGWSDIEVHMTCDLLYKHQRRVTCIQGLDMGRHIQSALQKTDTDNEFLVSVSS